jgi:hypothetical protein
MKKRLIAVVLTGTAGAVIAIASLPGGSGADVAVALPAEAPPTMSQIQEAAHQVAAKSGELAPTEIETTSGTLAQAARVIDPQGSAPNMTDPRTGEPWADSPVYVVTERGHFTYSGPTPKSRPAPTGTVLTVVIDAKSGQVVAEALNNVVPALDQINPTVSKLGD